MAQLFRPRANGIFRAVLFLGVAAGFGTLGLLYVQARSDAAWNIGKPAAQPIPFRHDLHAGTLGLDCRYCHSAVERAADAGMPSAQTCLTCHSQVLVGAGMLEPLRTAVTLGEPIRWASVSRLPGHAYFNHAVHVSANVACSSCHGAVETMPRTVKTETLSMGFCLDCHRGQERRPTALASLLGGPLHRAGRLADCSTCHR